MSLFLDKQKSPPADTAIQFLSISSQQPVFKDISHSQGEAGWSGGRSKKTYYKSGIFVGTLFAHFPLNLIWRAGNRSSLIYGNRFSG
ncbi:MAG TPA: hypothetical protein VET88_05500, partial [Gammaproteobacteria bacterium]|nr:hypothetical protein [Gammaproteobacteria bacterium]